jgi:oligopeptide/dipeptide ABC transporter ATP-binding protein
LGDRAGRRAVVERLLAQVGLDPGVGRRFPHEFSGGQAQRIAIARALAMSPELIVADEPVSALDVSIQAQIINLLVRLRRELSLSMLFIAHDLAVVRHIADRVAVMYLGRIVEIGTRDAIFNLPAHPYTRALLAAVPIPDPAIERMREGAVLSGDLPSPTNVPSGCAFRTRCPLYRQLGDPCKAEVPALRAAAAGQQAACHFLDEEGRAP